VAEYEEDSKLTGNQRKMRFSGHDDWAVRDWVDGRAPYDLDSLRARQQKAAAKAAAYAEQLIEARRAGKGVNAAQKKADAAQARVEKTEATIAAAERGETRQMAPYQRETSSCDICGAEEMATKAVGCDFVQPAEYVQVPSRKSLPVLQTPQQAPEAPETTPDTPVQIIPVQVIDEPVIEPVVSETMSDQTTTEHLVTVTKKPFGDIALSYRSSDATFVIEFAHEGVAQTFEHTNVSRCAKHLFCLKKGHASFEAAVAAGVKVPGIGGLKSTYWGRKPLSIDGSAPAPTKPATKRSKKAKKTAAAPAVTETPEPVPASPVAPVVRVKMPVVDHGQLPTSEVWAQYLILIHGAQDPAPVADAKVAPDASQAVWQAAIRELMTDGVKRTFNAITSALAGIEAELASDDAIAALWALVEDEGALYHNLVGRPFSFWAPAADETLSAEAEALLRAQASS
jgi:hypothetical protein